MNYLDFPQVLVEMKMSEEEVYQIEEWIEETKIMKFRNQRKGKENEKDFCKHWQILNKLNKGKVLSLFEACFDLILSPSPSMKIQIMGRKITDKLGFKSTLLKAKFFFVLFLFIPL